VKETQNICFLLLVNKKCPTSSSSSDDFEASFELTATPVFDIQNLINGWVAGNNGDNLFVHTFSQNTRYGFVISGIYYNKTPNNPDIVSYTVNYFNSNRSEINDSSYVVNAHFSDETRYEFPSSEPWIISLPSIQISDNTQRIEYNFVRGSIKIHSDEKYIEKYEEKDENDIPVIYKDGESYIDATFWIKNLYSMTILTGGDNVVFKTRNSAETQSAIEKMSYTYRHVAFDRKGDPTSDNTYEYQSTDYSSGDIILQLIFQTK